jgi:hypothetical protein
VGEIVKPLSNVELSHAEGSAAASAAFAFPLNETRQILKSNSTPVFLE